MAASKFTTTPSPIEVVEKVNAVIDDVAGKLSTSGTAVAASTLSGLTATVTELNYVDGVTSNIQTQLNGKLNSTAQAADSAKLGGTAASSYAKLASPTFTGTVTVPTLTVSTTLNIPGGKIWIA